jgi:hypothetical protein
VPALWPADLGPHALRIGRADTATIDSTTSSNVCFNSRHAMVQLSASRDGDSLLGAQLGLPSRMSVRTRPRTSATVEIDHDL